MFTAIVGCSADFPAANSCPSQCTSCNKDNAICTIMNPTLSFNCPVGFKCIIKCYEGACAAVTGTCANGAGPCDWYCFGNASCALATMVCSTNYPCRSHCTSQDPASNQIIREHKCLPAAGGLESCDCNSNCLIQKDIKTPCFIDPPSTLLQKTASPLVERPC